MEIKKAGRVVYPSCFLYEGGMCGAISGLLLDQLGLVT